MDIVESWSLSNMQDNSSTKDSSETCAKSTNKSEICRLCGESDDICISIFNNKLSIAEKISRCLPIIVLPKDNLPSHICKRCLSYLNISYKLIVNSLKVDSELRQKLSDEKKKEENSNTKEKESSELTEETTPLIPLKKLKKFAVHGPIICEFCNTKFTDVNNFDKHFEAVHILKWKCNFCDESFETSNELITHKSATHAGKIIICKTCVDEEEAEEKMLKKRNVEMDYISSGEDYDEKFYIPADPPPDLKPANLKLSEKNSTAALNDSQSVEIPNLPEISLNPSLDNQNLAIASLRKQILLSPNSQSAPANDSFDKSMVKNEPEDANKLYYTCDVCNLHVDDKKLFELHQKIHIPRTVACVLCKKESQTIYELYLHKKEAHNLYSKVNLKYVCDKCGKFFSNSWQWEEHKIRRCRNRQGYNRCKYCSASFTTKHKLNKHLRKHKEEMFSDPTVKIFKCVSCPKIFVDEEFYQKHRNVHDPECWNNFKCTICSRSFRDNVRLREHMKSIHEGVKPHVCDVCGKSFHRLSNMKVHRALHFGHKCNTCDEVFDKSKLLVNHIKEIHGLEPPASLASRKAYISGSHICKYCGRTLATHQSLLDHEHIHTGEKPYPCDICDKSFRSYTARWSHMQRHNKGTFICEQCGKCFSFKQNLMTHIQIHVSMEERKYQCQICQKRFLRKAHLNVHMRIHDGLRPYTCDICNFSFTQIGDMRRHRARHVNGEVLKRKPKERTRKWTYNTSNEDTN